MVRISKSSRLIPKHSDSSLLLLIYWFCGKSSIENSSSYFVLILSLLYQGRIKMEMESRVREIYNQHTIHSVCLHFCKLFTKPKKIYASLLVHCSLSFKCPSFDFIVIAMGYRKQKHVISWIFLFCTWIARLLLLLLAHTVYMWHKATYTNRDNKSTLHSRNLL